MKKENLNSNLNQINNLQYLSKSINNEIINPFSKIQSVCESAKNYLEEVIECLDLISVSSSKGLITSEIILQNISSKEIDKNKFVHLSISDVVDSAIARYVFSGEEEINLLNIELEDDFSFIGDELLMIFVILNLLKNFLYYKTKIHIWLDRKKRCLHFKTIIQKQNIHFFDDPNWQFCERVILSFDGKISCQFKEDKMVGLCLQF